MRKGLASRLLNRLVVESGILLEHASSQIASRTLPEFAHSGRNLQIELPRKIINPARIYLGDDVWLGPGTLLMAVMQYPGGQMRHPHREQRIQVFEPRLTIGSRVSSTANLQVAAHSQITIEDDVMFASNVNITDGSHSYETANEPYKYQGIFRIAPIFIGQGCWIGQNTVILPGVTIGELAIVGANSVVTRDIPPQSVAVGAPARVIKRWEQESQAWIHVSEAE